VDGYEIIVDGKLAGNKITGTVDTPDGKVNFTATKVEKK
jgi:ribosomal protein S3